MGGGSGIVDQGCAVEVRLCVRVVYVCGRTLLRRVYACVLVCSPCFVCCSAVYCVHVREEEGRKREKTKRKIQHYYSHLCSSLASPHHPYLIRQSPPNSSTSRSACVPSEGRASTFPPFPAFFPNYVGARDHAYYSIMGVSYEHMGGAPV